MLADLWMCGLYIFFGFFLEGLILMVFISESILCFVYVLGLLSDICRLVNLRWSYGLVRMINVRKRSLVLFWIYWIIIIFCYRLCCYQMHLHLKLYRYFLIRLYQLIWLFLSQQLLLWFLVKFSHKLIVQVSIKLW